MKRNVLPDKWRLSQIGDVCLPISTVGFNQLSPEGALYVDISSIDNELKRITGVVRITNAEAPSRARQIIETNDVLVSTVRPALNAVALVPSYLNGEICSTGFSVLRANPSLLLPEFLFAWVRHSAFVQNLVKQEHGIGYPAVSNSVVQSSLVPLPALSEQERIVLILQQASELMGVHHELSEKSDELLTSIFEEMFGSPKTGWPECRLRDVIAQLQPGKSLTAKPHPAAENQWGVLKVSAVTSGKFLSEENKELPEDTSPNLAFEVHNGDLLISRANTEELVGASAIVTNCRNKLLLSDKLWRVMLPKKSAINIQFLHALLNSQVMRKQISQAASGTSGSMKNIAQEKFLNLRVVIPPKSLQDKFAERVQVLQETVLGNQTTAAENIDRLWESLLSQAFNGELTAAWRKKHKAALSTAAKKRDQEWQRATLAFAPTTPSVAIESGRSLPSQAASEGATEKTTSPNPVLLPFDPPAVAESVNVDASELLPTETVAQPVGLLANFSAVQQKVWAAAQVMKGRFTAESLREKVQSLSSDADINAVMVRRGLEVLAAAGLLLPVSLAAQTSEAGEFFFTAYRALRPEDDGRADRNTLEVETA